MLLRLLLPSIAGASTYIVLSVGGHISNLFIAFKGINLRNLTHFLPKLFLSDIYFVYIEINCINHQIRPFVV